MTMAGESLKGKTLFITGASRGIGLAIALRAAREGANVTIAAKTAEPHWRLPGTIGESAKAIEAAGGRALPIQVDVRDETQVRDAVAQTVETFGGVDICVNNASAIDQTTFLETEMKRFDLVHAVVARGSFLVTQACMPHLLKAKNPHVLMFCGPPVVGPRFTASHNAVAKLSVGLYTVGLAHEFAEQGVAVNALRPRTWVATAAIQFRRGDEAMVHCRKPEIMADAACAIFRRPSRSFTGHFVIDDEILYEDGERDFEKYSFEPGAYLYGSGMTAEDTLPDYLSNIGPVPTHVPLRANAPPREVAQS
jgi:citronellol/citronellal dehydrogenase